MKSGLHQCSPWTTPGPLMHVFRDALLQWQRARKEKRVAQIRKLILALQLTGCGSLIRMFTFFRLFLISQNGNHTSYLKGLFAEIKEILYEGTWPWPPSLPLESLSGTWSLLSIILNIPQMGSQLEVMGIHSLSLLALGHVEVRTMTTHTWQSGGSILPGPKVGVDSELPRRTVQGGRAFSELFVSNDWAFPFLHLPQNKWHCFLPVLEGLLSSSSCLTPSLIPSSVLFTLPPGSLSEPPGPLPGDLWTGKLSASFLQEACDSVLFYLPAFSSPILQARRNLLTRGLMSSLLLQILTGCSRQAQFTHCLPSPPPQSHWISSPGNLPRPLASPIHHVPALQITLCGWSLLALGAQLCSTDWPFLITLFKASLPPLLSPKDAPAHGFQDIYHNPSLLSTFFSPFFRELLSPESGRVPET